MANSERYAALKYRDFRLLWLGLFLSNIGSQMQFTAINWHIYILTHSAFALGLIGLSRFIPIAIFAVVGGTIADAHNRKKILLITQVCLTLLSGFLALMTLSQNVHPIIIYIVTALSALVMAFDTPPRQAIIPSLVKKEHLPNAMSLNVIMWQTSSIVGPALAGLLIATLGIGSIYIFNTFSFISVIAALLLMETSGEIEGEATPVTLKAMLDGFRFVKSKTIIWSTMILDFFSTFFASATALLPLFAETILHVGPTGFGILSAAPSIGAVITGFLMAHFGIIKKQGKLLLIAVAVYGIATIIFGLSKIFLLSFFALFLIGTGDSISTVIRNTIRQLATPDYIRGRMTSVNMIFFMGGPQLGEFEAGALAAAVGGPVSVIIGGVGTLIVVGLVALKVPVLRNYTGEKNIG
jgi:MFS family permease